MPSVFLLLGSNEGHSVELLKKVRKEISERIGDIRQASSIYITQAWGKTDQNDFYNQAIRVMTRKWPHTVLDLCLEIEKDLGRHRIEKWGPRTIDIDILFYGERIVNTKDLIIPHPHFEKRNFAIIPMLEIASNFKHPKNQKTIEDIYLESEDELSVYMLDNNE